ncbi:MAG: hypothetical protein PHV05_09870 [Candidatus Riflebacteria bacterium]|nr:hypothetical protein [Candidatus Riflebacteria bacterium]
MKTLVGYWKAYLQAFPFSFVGSVLCFYFVVPGFDKSNLARLIVASSTMAVCVTLVIAIARQKVQFELGFSSREKFVAEICDFIAASGGKLIRKSNALIFFKKGAFEITIAIGSNKALFSGTKIWLAPLYDKIKNQFQS